MEPLINLPSLEKISNYDYEPKDVARTSLKPDDRAREVQQNTESRIKKLDSDFPGSAFEKTYRSYGENGRFLVLVIVPFADLPEDFAIRVCFLARRRATRLLDQWDTTPGQALALNRKALVHKFGHLASLLWARLILGRFQDVVPHTPFGATSNSSEFPAETENEAES